MCQWSTKYYPKVVGDDLNGQLDFLMGMLFSHIITAEFKHAI
jgi:hypothetical protein